ncbi:MAG: NAD(+) synthase [Chloroflexota bacterium]
MEQVRCRLVDWIKARVAEAGAQGVVLGLSGGIDSAVVAALCQQALGESTLALVLPIHSLAEDVEHAHLVANHFGIRVVTLPMEEPFSALQSVLPSDVADEKRRALAVANLKPRLRMLTLYYYANLFNYLVVGTSNRSELAVGYFTKFGDGAADILPIAGLVKQQVRELARHLGVPGPVIDKPPSAGLWAGQTDESEMGVTYAQIDRWVSKGEAEPSVAALLARRYQLSEHKRTRPPVASVDDLLAKR